MPTHYVYDDPDKTQLAQGDVLQRTDELVALLGQYHPHYAEHPDYKFFAVLTQSCDLVRRDGKPPKCPYITIAAARTLEETLLREAAKGQSNWQRQTKVVGLRERNSLLMFLQRVIDNNEPGYFYLHEDQSVGIHRACCVVLPLGVSLRVQHYDLLLKAKIAQVKDTFQAKLGWLIGHMYGRVGTTEWDKEHPDRPVKTVSKEVLEATLHSLGDDQIKEGVAQLKREGQLENMTPEEIFEHIRRRSILSRSKKLENRAAEVSKSLRLVNLIQGRASTAIHHGDALKQSLRQILMDAKTSEEAVDALADQLIGAVNRRISEVMTDADLPGRDDIALKFIRGLLQDPQIAAILK
jgi:hypothetical protein